MIRPAVYVNPDELEWIERIARLFALTAGGELRIGVATSILVRLGLDHLLSEPEFPINEDFWEKHYLDAGLAVTYRRSQIERLRKADPDAPSKARTAAKVPRRSG